MNNIIQLTQRWRIPLAVATGMHGIGHVLFLVPLLGIANWGQPTQSWLLLGATGHVAAQVAGSLLWLASIGGFVVVAARVAKTGDWNRAAVISSLVSLAGITLFWSSAPTSSMLYAAIFDIVILAIARLMHTQPRPATH